VIDGKGLQVYPGLFRSGSRQMGVCAENWGRSGATVDSAETGGFNPDPSLPRRAVLPVKVNTIPVTALPLAFTEGARCACQRWQWIRLGQAGVLGGQASAIHLSGWTISDMLLKKSVAMVLNWPEIKTQTFDFSTFFQKSKNRSPDAKQEYEKQVDELTDWLERAPSLCAKRWATAGPGDFQRDTVKLDALVPVTRGELPVLVFRGPRARDIRNAVEFCEKAKS